jgi:hypothetical protein
MLKYWVGLLVLLNAVAMAWQWDAFAPWGLGPQQHQEPERLKQQLRPEALQPVILNANEQAAPTEAMPQQPGTQSSPTSPLGSSAAQGTALPPSVSPAIPTAPR